MYEDFEKARGKGPAGCKMESEQVLFLSKSPDGAITTTPKDLKLYDFLADALIEVAYSNLDLL